MHAIPLTLLTVWSLSATAADISVDTETGLATWQTETDGIQVRLTQISPDQARAFYQARGFTALAAERYASECVFMTVVRNLGDIPIDHDLADWRYVTTGHPPRAIRSKTEWARIWQDMGVGNSARIAFNWAQFPATQTFAPGDWNQGMTAYSVPRGQALDLHFIWRAQGTQYSGKLEHVRCANEQP
jgi:hypothetical protein